MDEQLLQLIEKLGTEGINVVYLFLILDYGLGILFLGLLTVGVRAVWKKVKPLMDT